MDIETRFWNKVDKDGPIHSVLRDECWIWIGAKHEQGYGLIARDKTGSKILAHVLAWTIYTGKPVPKGYEVCHKCDNPPCVKHEHLFIGTHSENMDDAVKKGTWGKLTPGQVAIIRASSTSMYRLAEQFGVSQGAIWNCKRYNTYRHLP